MGDSTLPTDPTAREEAQQEKADEHEKDVEQREAYEYWGYLFKPDKTGTDKLKALLRGLKDLINEQYEPSDNPDLTPNQLAHFYRDLHGNYDQLFLGTPSESIAFIYKSLGCLHSLQPLHHTHQTAFTDPTVPALKTEGWIMWQTIQLLLGPEEHSSFLREAVAKWDVRDHDTGAIFPKILPRECFPLDPDKHMVAWYEGVSERLRREAEEEERHKQIEVEHDLDQPPPRRVRDRPHGPPHGPPRPEGEVLSEDDGASVDSRGPALAYFRNPLYRHVDGRPSIVRKNSKRPGLSPRATMIDKGKAAAASFGRIARGVGSPHLWAGEGRHSRSHSRDHHDHHDHHERRRSHPDGRHAADDPLSPEPYDERYEPRAHSSHSHSRSSRHRRRASQQVDRAAAGALADDEMEESEASPVYSPPTGSNSSRHRHHRGPSDARLSDRDQPLRHSKSHEPTPSQREGDDYFAGANPDEPPPSGRRSSVHDRPNTPPVQYNEFGPSFAPSASPLFAATVSKHPPPPAPPHPRAMPHRGPPGGMPPPPGPEYDGGPPARHPSRRMHDRYASRSPGRDDRGYDRPRRYDEPSGPYDARPPPPNGYPHGPPPGRDPRDPRDPRYPPGDFTPPPPRDPRDRGYPPPDDRRPPSRDPRDFPPPRDPRDRDPRDRRSSRGNIPPPPPEDDYEDDRRHSRPKQTRFADTGVSGRRYPDETGLRRGS
ncbi:hypothetical protein CB0940_12023 [Cercospora beticola]|uniref:DUF7514 domain-containing protein n=1 Tax=Cercospora beticola TaxID=122368 RepID=A0A2G5IDZ3_CERBT|nr:hypothetical protein CB0940_12023 [Cercospora beticola]PIB02882.1 hypothetical protein CB0940_12023 [Cercospora beticola]WPB04407.1 hypothetical protein RHO25_009053 [Cercospora beticola]CAK1356764.1 unnamed protein product [Cercospora beticola]